MQPVQTQGEGRDQCASEISEPIAVFDRTIFHNTVADLISVDTHVPLGDARSASSTNKEAQPPHAAAKLRMSSKEDVSLSNVLAEGLIRCRDEIARNERLRTPEAVLQVPVWKWID